jgi:hypothetical protein
MCHKQVSGKLMVNQLKIRQKKIWSPVFVVTLISVILDGLWNIYLRQEAKQRFLH